MATMDSNSPPIVEEAPDTTKEPLTLQTLPLEIVNRIICTIPTLDGHVHLSQVNKAFRQIYTDKGDSFWKALCLKSGFSRPNIHKSQTWTAMAAGIVHHTYNCAVCKACVVELGERDLTNVLQKPKPKVSVIDSGKFIGRKKTEKPVVEPRLRPFFRKYDKQRFDVHWWEDKVCDRPLIREDFYRKSMNIDKKVDLWEEPSRRLRLHVAMSSLTITLRPINKITCAATSHTPFGNYEAEIYDYEWDSDQETYGEPDILHNGMEGYVWPHKVENADGLTCLDVLTAAADVPGEPMAHCGETLIFHQARLELASGTLYFDNVR